MKGKVGQLATSKYLTTVDLQRYRRTDISFKTLGMCCSAIMLLACSEARTGETVLNARYTGPNELTLDNKAMSQDAVQEAIELACKKGSVRLAIIGSSDELEQMETIAIKVKRATNNCSLKISIATFGR